MQSSTNNTPGAAAGSAAASQKIRAILFATFGALLILFAAAGIYSFKTLRDLHSVEQRVRERMANRSQVLVKVTRSIEVYNDDVDSFLLAGTAASSDQAGPVFIREVSTIEAELQNYPSDMTQEGPLFGELSQDLLYEDRRMATALAWSVEDRRQRGPAFLREQIFPERVAMLQVVQRISAMTDQQLADDDGDLLAMFRKTRIKLGWALGAMLILATALSLVSTIYILRLQLLERERYDELVERRRELQDLSARLVDVQEQERRAMSRELHDEVGQSLEALLVETARLVKTVPAENEAAQEQIGRIRSIVEGLVKMVRDIALLLRPSMLDDLGLTAALEWQAREVSRRSEMEVEVYAENVSDELDDLHKICVYRLAQEALNNAVRHAEATTATVRVVQSDRKIMIEIADNGKSFDAQNLRGMGLIGMEERVRRLGGSLTIESHPSVGTKVRAELPLGGAQLSQSA
ncbi:MAG TPA: sensor histidine kinase [Terriglobales bacterium]